ncbi:uncharacterized protein LOC129002829 [Macrosteles quadrilineatus]|uniref:uncharacterized protein LOC129002829 n=1 Tax=Macrosteles quadrilineatus TaxID=74068 RepID=UPI0023E324A5|nr:uncharacterized protein LOC129002829 [Macrosteles quadrilineatus]XP_054286884.1 uncharacterized protein LOC129002829 [Macrosteles quadrilineatus]
MVPSNVLAATLILLIGSNVSAKNMALETNDVTDHFLSTTIDWVFDLFLRHYTSKLIEQNKTQIEIQGFERGFSTKILSLRIEGVIKVEDGIAGNLSTLHRTGDAEMNRVNSILYLSAHLGLNDLQIDFDNYDISLLGAHQKGRIHATVGTNSLFLKMKVQVEPECAVLLEELRIEKLEDIEVDITNLGIFENLTDEITSWVINEVTKFYRSYVEEKLFPELAAVVKEADLCHYIPH